MSEPLLEVSNLTLDYNLGDRKMRALDRINFTLDRGEVLGVAGESGCGKSTLGLAILRLLPRVAEIRRGAVLFDGTDLLKLTEEQMEQDIRGQKISMIFQTHRMRLTRYSGLNPR
jgi:peptide/nickel transport system ATP-binding protein